MGNNFIMKTLNSNKLKFNSFMAIFFLDKLSLINTHVVIIPKRQGMVFGEKYCSRKLQENF